MKLDFRLHAGSDSREHELELASPPGAREASGRLTLVFDGEAAEADWVEISPGNYSILLGGRSYDVRIETRRGEPAGGEIPFTARVGTGAYQLELRDPRRRRQARTVRAHEGPQEILAPMPGKIVKLLVSENQDVGLGDSLLVIEAMKMQNELRAPRAGRVEKIYVGEGMGVESGGKLLRLV